MTDSDPPRTTGVVLAGGESTRFRGGNKALATVDGERFVERVLAAVTSVSDTRPVLAVRTHRQREVIDDGLESAPRYAYDVEQFSGPLAGLYGALDVVETPWVLVTGCDMPFLSVQVLSELSEHRWTRAGDAVVPVAEDGSIEPLHAFYRRSALLDAGGNLSPTAGMKAVPRTLTDVEYVSASDLPAHVSLARSTTNVNTLDQLRRHR